MRWEEHPRLCPTTDRSRCRSDGGGVYPRVGGEACGPGSPPGEPLQNSLRLSFWGEVKGRDGFCREGDLNISNGLKGRRWVLSGRHVNFFCGGGWKKKKETFCLLPKPIFRSPDPPSAHLSYRQITGFLLYGPNTS